MEIVFDLEANGLHLPQYDKRKDEWKLVADRVWCINLKSVEGDYKGDMYDCLEDIMHPDKVLDHFFQKATTLIGHNIIGYDLPLLKRLYGWEPAKGTRIVDTLILSRLLNPDRGSHSLDAWGERLGYPKGEHNEWERYSPEMLSYCQRDVELTRQVYLALLEEMGDWDWSEAIELEHSFAQIMQRQEENGVYFDMSAALELVDTIRTEVEEIDGNYNLPGRYKQHLSTINRPYRLNGELSKRAVDSGIPRDQIAGPFSRVRFERLNLGSEKQVKEYLLTQGWVPTQYNYVDGRATSPKLTEDSFGTIDGEFGQKILRRRACTHKLSQLEGWIKNVRPDGRITASANTIGTNTGRCRHQTVVNVPASRAPFGKELRSLFSVPEGYKMVGHDADQLELRMLAHYMGDEEYIQQVLEGDIHTYNQELAGLPTRDAAKTFIYAFIYGAGNEKLGKIVGGGARKGAQVRKNFLEGLPKIKLLIENVKRASERGFLVGLDGRKIWMRNGYDGRPMTHKALNTLLQSAGAVLMKRSAIILDSIIQDMELPAKKVIDMHDEAQAEVQEEYTLSYCVSAEQSVVMAGESFNLRIPMKATADVGNNWYETH